VFVGDAVAAAAAAAGEIGLVVTDALLQFETHHIRQLIITIQSVNDLCCPREQSVVN